MSVRRVTWMFCLICMCCSTYSADFGGFYIEEKQVCGPNSLDLSCHDNEVIMVLKATLYRTNKNCNRRRCSIELDVHNVTMYRGLVEKCSGQEQCTIEVTSELLASIRCDNKGSVTLMKVDHICVPRQSVIPACSNRTRNLNKGVIISDSYPKPLPPWTYPQQSNVKPQPVSVIPEYTCECKLSVDDEIRLQLIEVDFNSSCQQKLEVCDEDNGDDYTYECQAGYQRQEDIVQQSDKLKITFRRTQGYTSRSIAGGRFALVFRKQSSVSVTSRPKIQIQCRHVPPQWPTIPTPSPDVTTSPVSVWSSTPTMEPTGSTVTVTDPAPETTLLTTEGTDDGNGQSGVLAQKGAVIGGSIGGVVVVLLVIGVILFIIIRRRKSPKQTSTRFDDVDPNYTNKGFNATEQSENIYYEPHDASENQYQSIRHKPSNDDYELPVQSQLNVYTKLNTPGQSFGNGIYSEPDGTPTENIYDSLDQRHAEYQSRAENGHISNPYYSHGHSDENSGVAYHELEADSGGKPHSGSALGVQDRPAYFELETDDTRVQPTAPSMNTIRQSGDAAYFDLEIK